MDVGIDKAKLLHYKEITAKHLSNPVKLRLTTVFLLVALAIGMIYMPLSNRLQEARKQLANERERNKKITDINKLRKCMNMYRNRIGEHSDTNEWVQYILDGLQNYKVRLRTMESHEPRRVGPYNAVSLSMEIEGTYAELKAIIRWLDMTKRILRIDSMRFEKRPDNLLMKIIVLGLVPKNARNNR
jgi:Tfp pilus assembly protein PilO